VYDPDKFNDFLRRKIVRRISVIRTRDPKIISLLGNKAVVCALSASYVSTFAGYPVRRSDNHTRTVMLNDPIAGLYQVATTDDENADNYSETRRPRVSGRGL
jgi:hypothetical protein